MKLSTLSLLGFGPVYEWADLPTERAGSDESDDGLVVPSHSEQISPVAGGATVRKSVDVGSQVNLHKGFVRFASADELTHEHEGVGKQNSALVSKTSVAFDAATTEGVGHTDSSGKWRGRLELCQAIGQLRGLATKLTVPPPPKREKFWGDERLSGPLEGPNDPVLVLRKPQVESPSQQAEYPQGVDPVIAGRGGEGLSRWWVCGGRERKRS